ncbi:MAG: hypothetical protein ACRD1Y_10290 [Terriglobales bacterium]
MSAGEQMQRLVPNARMTQQYVARVAITPSVFRTRARDSVKLSRCFLARLVLKGAGSPSYAAWLDARTEELAGILPKKTAEENSWGVARKALNVFMVLALQNRQLEEEFGLSLFEDDMEAPLDTEVMRKLRRLARETGKEVPLFIPIKMLKKGTSVPFQEVASACAGSNGVTRGRLDALLWTAPFDKARREVEHLLVSH